MLAIGNAFFFAFHTALILFNVFGWLWPRTRRWNLVTLLATLFSWAILGLWFGAGYCICTDWHMRIRRAMGIHDAEDSYIDLLVRVLTGWSPPPDLTRHVALVVFIVSLTGSVALNLRDRAQAKP